tara:strand:+ start:649 stop:1326 length:678 start_codon:yes stop_codon:yes gene_type:complete
MSKIILITGASSGIGEACARHSAKAGHTVVLAARSADKLEGLVAELGEKNALAVTCDVTDADQQKVMFATATDRFGRLDVVLANAGLGASAMGTEEGDIENFKEMVLVNNFGVTVTAKLAIPHLKASKGHLVFIGSRAGHATLPGSVYGATKWFIRGYAENVAAELSGTGARVTNINPGMVDTPFFDEPKPTALRPDDIARAFLYAIEQPEHVLIPSLQIYPKPQ